MDKCKSASNVSIESTWESLNKTSINSCLFVSCADCCSSMIDTDTDIEDLVQADMCVQLTPKTEEEKCVLTLKFTDKSRNFSEFSKISVLTSAGKVEAHVTQQREYLGTIYAQLVDEVDNQEGGEVMRMCRADWDFKRYKKENFWQ